MHRGVCAAFKRLRSAEPDGLLCMHSHQCITAFPGNLLLLHGTFPVAVLTFLSCAVRQSARKPHEATLPHKAILNSPGWLSGHVSRACSASLHLSPYGMLAKGNLQKLFFPFFSVLI